MILNYNDFLKEDRNFNDLRYSNMEQEFEPSVTVLQKSYYDELDKLYHSNIPKYRLILDILKSNKEVNDRIGKKTPFSFFKSLINLPESRLRLILKTWKDLKEDEWYLPDVKKK